MTDIATLEFLGIRFGTLGSAASLVVAAPLSEGSVDPDAVTDASRIGFYFDRTVAAEKVGIVVMGTDAHAFYDDRIEVLGNEVWHSSNLPNPESQNNKGQINGYAGLDVAGKVPYAQLPVTISGGLNFLGLWDANTNSPAIADGGGSSGDYYIVSVSGTQDLGSGNITFNLGDFAIYDSGVWNKVAVASVEFQVKGSAGDPTPGFLDAKVDGVTIQVNGSNELEVISSPQTAAGTTTDTSGFNNILSVADTNVQLALDTLNDHKHPFSDINEVTDTGTVALTNGVPVDVDSTVTGTGWKWFIKVTDGTDNTVVEVIAGAQDTSDVEYSIYPATADFPHTVAVDRTAGITRLRITASGAGFSARAWRFEMA